MEMREILIYGWHLHMYVCICMYVYMYYHSLHYYILVPTVY